MVKIENVNVLFFKTLSKNDLKKTNLLFLIVDKTFQNPFTEERLDKPTQEFKHRSGKSGKWLCKVNKY